MAKTYVVNYAEIKSMNNKPPKDPGPTLARITIEAEVSEDLQHMAANLSGLWRVTFTRQQALLEEAEPETSAGS
jgi:hypothetical protein